MIRKVGGKYKVISHKTGKSMGEYDSLEKAKKRLALIKWFAKKKRRS